MLGLGNILTKGGALLGFPNKYSFNFDGSNDYLDCGDSLGNSLGTTTALTLSIWVKNDNSSQDAGIFKIGDGNAGNFSLSYASNNYYLNLDTNDSGSVTAYAGFSNTDTSSWHHIVAVYNGTNAIAIYFDGSAQSLSGSGTPPSSIDFTGLKTLVGQYYSSEWDGLIDEVAIWNTALSASDVAKIASKPVDFSKASTYATDRTSNLKLWLRAGDKVLPEEDTSIARSDFYTDFDGSNDRVVFGTSMASGLGDSYSANQGLSVTCWFKNDGTTDGGLFQIGNNGGAGEFSFQKDNNNDLYFLLNGNGWHRKVSFTDTSSWHHVACIYGSSEANSKIYLDGEAVGTAGGSFPSTLDFNGLHTTIGDYWNLAYSWLGKISNVSVYQTALDAQTIKQFAKSRFSSIRENNRFSVVDFDGTNDVIAMTTSSAVSPTEAITVSAWVNFTSLEDYDLVVGNTDTGSNGWRLAMDNADNIIFAINSWGSNHAETPMSSTGVWHHLVGTYDKSNIKIYLDGELKGTDSYTDSITYSSNVFQIGGASGWSNLTGSISSVAIYNVAKSADEVYAIYQQGITYDESSLSGLVGYWRMGDDTSKAYPTIADSSSNSNDGTMTSMASDDIVQQMVAGYDMGAFESTGELGSEILTNGTFDADSNWTKGDGWSIANGVASSDETAQSSGHPAITQSVSLTSGTLYKVTYDIVYNDSSGNGFLVQIYGGGTLSGTARTSSGSFTDYFLAVANHTTFSIRSSDGTANGTIDNVSLKEVIQSDLSDTYPAIIDVNEPVLGAELVTSNTTSDWAQYGSGGSEANTANGVALTAGSDVRNAYRTVSGLTDGKLYKLNVDAYYSGSSDTPQLAIIPGSGTLYTDVLTTTSTNYSIYFVKNSGTVYVLGHGVDNGNVLYVENLTIKEIQGNVGTMTNQDSADLVYSSVLPDQSFLTGVNSAYNFVSLDGTNDYIKNESFTGHQSSKGTLSGWVKLGDVSGYQYLVSVGGTTTTGATRSIAFQNNEVFFAGYGENWVSSATVSADTWYHLALTWDGTSIILYLNGTGYSQTLSNLVTPTGTKISVGVSAWDFASFINADISGVAVWNKVLSSTEISAIHTAGRHSNLLDSYSDNLKAYYVFGALDSATGFSDTATTIYDRSGNSNHGTTVSIASSDLASSPNAEPNGYAKGDTNRSTTIP